MKIAKGSTLSTDPNLVIKPLRNILQCLDVGDVGADVSLWISSFNILSEPVSQDLIVPSSPNLWAS